MPRVERSCPRNYGHCAVIALAPPEGRVKVTRGSSAQPCALQDRCRYYLGLADDEEETQWRARIKKNPGADKPTAPAKDANAKNKP